MFTIEDIKNFKEVENAKSSKEYQNYRSNKEQLIFKISEAINNLEDSGYEVNDEDINNAQMLIKESNEITQEFFSIFKKEKVEVVSDLTDKLDPSASFYWFEKYTQSYFGDVLNNYYNDSGYFKISNDSDAESKELDMIAESIKSDDENKVILPISKDKKYIKLDEFNNSYIMDKKDYDAYLSNKTIEDYIYTLKTVIKDLKDSNANLNKFKNICSYLQKQFEAFLKSLEDSYKYSKEHIKIKRDDKLITLESFNKSITPVSDRKETGYVLPSKFFGATKEDSRRILENNRKTTLEALRKILHEL